MNRLVLWHRLVPMPEEPVPERGTVDETRRRARWTRAIVGRIRAARGTLLCTVGGTVAAAFDTLDLPEAMELSISLIHAAEREEPPFEISLGLAVGTVEEAADDPSFPFPTGTAIDRAQLLANRARPGELVVDASVRALADRVYLFGRTVGTGSSGLRGEALDRQHSRREECRRAIRHLRPPPVPPSTVEVTSKIADALLAGGRHRVLLRGPSSAGARDWVDALARAQDPALVLAMEGVPGGLEPLGSLRLALLRRWGTPEGVSAAALAAAVDRRAVATLRRISEGHAVERMPTVHALRSLLTTHLEDGRGVWVVLDPLADVDTATLDAVASAAGEGGPSVVVIARLAPEAEPPPMLLRAADVHEVRLSGLRPRDARAVAREILGPHTDEDVVRRVAVLGGDTPLGVVEAARTLVAAGDLVFGEGGFSWRRSPRAAHEGIAAESLIEERIATLAPTLHRVLEAVCVAPIGASNAVLRLVLLADGLGEDDLPRAISELRGEALLREDDPWQPTSDLLRHVVQEAMQPARQSELDRFVADAIAQTSHRDGEFVKATIGWYLAEGGRERDGARALIEAGRAAQLSGFTRAALRLAAAAVQFDESDQTRAAATTLTRAATRAIPPPVPRAARGASYVPPAPASVVAPAEPDAETDLVERSIAAIHDRDFEAADRLVDIAIAEGRDRCAAERVRALACLARGEREDAMRHLAQSRSIARDERAEARGALAHALILLHVGDMHGAVRAALASLGTSRARRDPRGEAATLHVLALCYRILGRVEDADAIEEASPG